MAGHRRFYVLKSGAPSFQNGTAAVQSKATLRFLIKMALRLSFSGIFSGALLLLVSHTFINFVKVLFEKK